MAPNTRRTGGSSTEPSGSNPPAPQEEEAYDGFENIQTDPNEGPSNQLRDGGVPLPDIQGDEETLIQRREELRAQLRRRRLEREIADMQAELAGQDPQQYHHIEGTSLPTHKRYLSETSASKHDTSIAKYLKTKTPPTFDGKSIDMFTKYDRGWRAIHRTLPPCAHDQYAERIQFAATFLTDRAEEAWDRDQPTFTMWDEYTDYLKSIIASPAIRKSQALIRLAEIKQRKDQSVRELLTVVETIEGEIPPMTEDERKAWVLLNALSPALRAEVMHEHKEITSREQVLASAQRHEDVIKQRLRSESSAKSTIAAPTPAKKPFKGNAKATPRAADKTQEKTPTPSDKGDKGSQPFTGACHNCGKIGHKAVDCRSKKRDTSGSPAASKDKSKK